METWYLPHAAASLPPARRVLVLAPHPDDEIFGCGGCLALYRQAGAAVDVQVFTDGAGYLPANQRAQVFGVRQAETNAALAVLGLGAAAFLGLPDRSLSGHAGLANLVSALIVQHRPDVVFAPSLWEVHPDHLALGRAALAALQAVADREMAPTLLLYEVGAPLRPELLIDITSVWQLKQQAMTCFVSQQNQQDYARHIASLNAYRTYTLPAAVRYAEALACVRPAELNALSAAGPDPARSLMGRWIEAALAAADAQAEFMQLALVRSEGVLAQVQQDAARTAQDLEQARAEAARHEASLRAAEHSLLVLLASRSWRITAPLRWLSRRLLGRD